MSEKYKIKLCGMMREQDIDYANEANPDYVGFVFADTRRLITKEQAKRFRAKLKPDILAVGVFVDEKPEIVGELLSDGIIDIAQLHGHENQEYVKKLRNICNKPIIKAVKVTSATDIVEAGGLDVDYLLLDTYKKGVLGGTGETFNWSIIREAKEHDNIPGDNGTLFGKPFFLAGGLTLNNLEQAAREVYPYGLDISTGIETDGKKDRNKMIEAVRRIRDV